MSWLFAAFGFVLALIALILAIVALSAGVAAPRVARLEAELTALRRRLDELREIVERNSRRSELGETASVAQPPPATESPPVTQAPLVVEAEAAAPMPEQAVPAPAIEHAPGAKPAWPAVSLEERFVSNWLVWNGGVALALAGAFLVKLSIDEGWITPPLRIAAGLMLAIALVAAGEAAYRRLARAASPDAIPSYVPGALAAGGVFTGFGSIFAAYRLYELIGAAQAFGLLAAIALGAFALALRHGPFMAILGLVGAHAVPLLVANEAPAAWPLFSYIAIIGSAAALLTRKRAWWWLGSLNLGALILWPLAWFYASWNVADAYPSGLFLLFVAGLFFLVREGSREAADASFVPGWLGKPTQPANRAALIACVAVAALALFYVRSYNYAPPALALLAIFAAACLALGRREQALDGAPWVAAIGIAIPIALWHVPAFIARGAPPATLADETTMIATAIGFGAVFGAGGYAALWRAKRPANWAALSVAAPMVLLFIAYAEATSFVRSTLWGGISIGVALIYLAAARAVARHRAESGMNAALGAYAVGAVAAIAGGIAFALPQVTLTMALALLVVAIAWVYRQMRLAPLRWVALALVAAVLVRLVFNPAIVNYHIGAAAPFNWLLYGYGVPVTALLLAAHWFGGHWRDAAALRAPVIVCLHVAALLLLTTGLVLELRAVMSADGRFDNMSYRLAEQAVQQAALLALGYGLLRMARDIASPVLRWGALGLFAIGAMHLVIFPLLATNPLLPPAFGAARSVGEWPILNTLLLLYAVPAAFAAAFYAEWRRQGAAELAKVAGVFSLTLTLAWLSLEVRHAFHGAELWRGATGPAEWYAYSAAWLGFGGVLLALGIWRRSTALRYASLTLVVIATAKIFLFDLAAIAGLYRVLSFLGLGLSLVAIGFFYRLYVFRGAPSRMPSVTG